MAPQDADTETNDDPSCAEQKQDIRGVLAKILPAAAGSFIEWYEFAIFGYLSTDITANFFADGHGGSLATWAGFAITFAFRPLGGAAFGWLADRLGRKPAMQLTIVCMLATTVAQGCLPTFYCCGEAWGWFGMVAMLLCRVLQGLSAGGELSTAAVYIAEVSPPGSLGFNTSWIAVSGAFGAYVVAALVIFVIESFLDREQMMMWGWRVPYLSSVIPGAAVILGRRFLTETEDFLDLAKAKSSAEPGALEDGAGGPAAEASSAQDRASPLRELFANHKMALAVGSLGSAGIGALWYVPPVYGVQFIQDYAGLPARSVTLSEVIVYLIPTILSPAVGLLVDAWGAGRVHCLALAFGCVLAPPPLLYWWTHVPPQQAVAVVYLGQAALGLLIALTASVYLWTIELFPVRVRVTGVSVAYNLGIGIFGGIGPLLCDAGNEIIDPRGLLSAPAIYMMAVGLMSLAVVAASRAMSSRGLLRVTHIRQHPY
eukprot:CAMPEP_0204602896 /NCGR_PEP_ID=MMETSP0661-20131031/56938_1 /ASSEMBLY_ACC=CAM_ASM_000606 /TAXON_ID=109239 /ORGANISM="Alexandrium margalefi, Strain AMGDE01CS-322" /LENGTH=484 /DNA_ID=CAMNT_0051613917 /DNA_START=108 /DNA_END=1562 /DNA_ORIENTATION=+